MTETILLGLLAAVALLVLLGQRKTTIVYPPSVGLLYRNGRFQRELPPGRYTFFDPGSRTRIVMVSLAALPTPLPELTVMSKDQFSFRLGLSPVLQVEDARAFAESQPGLAPGPQPGFLPAAPTHPALYPLAASAALEAAASYTLREIFAAPQPLVDAIQARLATALPGAGVTRLLVTAMTLPPETRKMFTEVERSRMEGEAALERARGEQASLRALANAARLIADNPALAQLRFLQTVEQTSGPKTIVMGSAALGIPAS